MNAANPDVQQALNNYHSTLNQTDLTRVTQAYTRDAGLIRTDGTILQMQGGDITRFWEPYLARGHKGVFHTVAVAVDGNTAQEICQYHFAIDSVRPGIEEGHYLAVRRCRDNQWRIETQAFCSSDRLMILLSNGEI